MRQKILSSLLALISSLLPTPTLSLSLDGNPSSCQRAPWLDVHRTIISFLHNDRSASNRINNYAHLIQPSEEHPDQECPVGRLALQILFKAGVEDGYRSQLSLIDNIGWDAMIRSGWPIIRLLRFGDFSDNDLDDMIAGELHITSRQINRSWELIQFKLNWPYNINYFSKTHNINYLAPICLTSCCMKFKYSSSVEAELKSGEIPELPEDHVPSENYEKALRCLRTEEDGSGFYFRNYIEQWVKGTGQVLFGEGIYAESMAYLSQEIHENPCTVATAFLAGAWAKLPIYNDDSSALLARAQNAVSGVPFWYLITTKRLHDHPMLRMLDELSMNFQGFLVDSGFFYYQDDLKEEGQKELKKGASNHGHVDGVTGSEKNEEILDNLEEEETESDNSSKKKKRKSKKKDRKKRKAKKQDDENADIEVTDDESSDTAASTTSKKKKPKIDYTRHMMEEVETTNVEIVVNLIMIIYIY